MSYNCDVAFCPDGNCAGCKDGKLWCNDPRCFPYCSSQCNITETQLKDSYLIIIGVIAILIGALIMLFLLICFRKNLDVKNETSPDTISS